MANKYLDYAGLQRLVAKIKELFVAKETGKGLSTNDYTTTEKNKLSGISAGAEVNQNAYSKVIAGETELTAATKTDSFTLTPGSNITFSVNPATKAITINGQSGAVQSDWNQSDSTKMDFIKNKPNLNSKADLASPAFTGTPTAPTATAGTSTTQIATTAFVQGEKVQPTTSTPLMDGTAAVGTETKYAKGDHRHPTDSSRAPLASPAFTGTPTAPTAAAGTNSTQLATTAFVKAAVDSAVSGAYKPQGSVTFANIPTTGLVVGYVYNISDAFTTDSRFVEGAGKAYPAGTNIVCVSTSATAKWDVLSGFVDLSNYLKTTDMVPITNAEIDAEFD